MLRPVASDPDRRHDVGNGWLVHLDDGRSPFDILAGLEAADGRLVPYEELATRATALHGDGFVIRAAALEDIIVAKERADRPKDREALPELRELSDGDRGPNAS